MFTPKLLHLSIIQNIYLFICNNGVEVLRLDNFWGHSDMRPSLWWRGGGVEYRYDDDGDGTGKKIKV